MSNVRVFAFISAQRATGRIDALLLPGVFARLNVCNATCIRALTRKGGSTGERGAR